METIETSNIPKFLSLQAAFCRQPAPAGYKHNSIAAFILAHGESFSEALPCRRGPMKECFRNAAIMAMDDSSLTYCEGYAVPANIPIPLQHAWCVDKDGKVLDPTWKDAHEYFGVRFSTRYLRRSMLKHKVYGLIDVRDFPVLKLDEKEWKEERV